MTASSRAALLYDNTTTETFDTLVFSTGAYDSIGDQIHLATAGNAAFARVQLFNAGTAGTFDTILRFAAVGTPVGSQIGGNFVLPGVVSTGGDVIDLTFNLGGLALPIDVIFLVSIANPTAGTDLGVNLFRSPTVGSSDPNFILVDLGGFGQALTDNEDVYFQLSDTSVPEPSSLALIGSALLMISFKVAGRAGSSPRRPIPPAR